ncbi:MAG: integrase [Haliea sp.]|nr:integrase [Haliea sp.]
MARTRGSKNRTDVSLTSITEATAWQFDADAEPGATLFCKKIPGFHLLKQVRGCAWRYRYTNAAGKRKTATISKRKYPAVKPVEAAAIAFEWYEEGTDPLTEKQAKRRSAEDALRAAERRVLHEYLEGAYSRNVMDVWAPRNKTANLRRFETLLADFLPRDMAGLTKQDINEWQGRLEQRGLAHSSIKRAWAALRALLNQAVVDEVLEANPLQGHRLRPPPYSQQREVIDDPEQKHRRLLTPKEVRGILEGLDKLADEIREQRRSSRRNGKPELPDLDQVPFPTWFIPFCRLALATGWRPGDLYTLRWEHVDLRFSGSLRKVAEKSRDVAARRGKDATLLETPLPDSAKRMLKQWHQQQGKPATGLVFPSPRTGSQLTNTAHHKPWKRTKELGKVPMALQFYALRHHAISAMVAAGIPMLTVARLVGHKDATMIQKHYAHLCPDSAGAAVDVVEATVAKAQGTKKNARHRGRL